MILSCKSCGADNRVPAARLYDKPRCGSCKTGIAVDAPMSIHSTADFDELVKGAPALVLVDFWAQWCGPCHAVAPQLERLAKKKAGAILVAKVDTDELQDVAARFAIRSIPTMILFADGREQRRISGAMPAEEIEARLA